MDLDAMKILMLNALTDRSGSGVRFWSISKELALRGYSLFFLERTIGKNGRRDREQLQYRSTVDTGMLWVDILRTTLLNFYQGFVFRPHWVFALKPMPNTCLPALFLKYLFKGKIILDIDDLDYEYYPKGMRRHLVRFFLKVFPRHFDVITTHNNHLRNFIIDELGISSERVYFLPQGIETEQFLSADPDQRYQTRWNLNSGDNVVVYSASLGITSDFEHVLPMLVDFLKGRDDIKILVIGDGVRRQYFVKEVEASGLHERMVFAGYIPHADMPGVLKLAKVGINYMAPTRANQCRASIKVREYLAAGLSVVCNPVGDTEIFKDYVTFCSSIEEFPEAMSKALEERTPDSVKAAQRFVELHYSWPHLIEDFLSYLRNSQT
ncbi:MAG: glycosyltransferase [Syntrophobacterales bacterium]|jgi:glycosyltransferase involved in cell wall biosynthesis